MTTCTANRDNRMMLDNLWGESMQSIADRHGLHLSRVHQIIQRVRESISYRPEMSRSEVGAKLRKRYDFRAESGTPEDMHRTILQEERSGWMR